MKMIYALAFAAASGPWNDDTYRFHATFFAIIIPMSKLTNSEETS